MSWQQTSSEPCCWGTTWLMLSSSNAVSGPYNATKERAKALFRQHPLFLEQMQCSQPVGDLSYIRGRRRAQEAGQGAKGGRPGGKGRHRRG